MTENGYQKLTPLWAGLLIISGLAPLFAVASESNVAMSVSVDNGLVSVIANNVTAGDLLQEIAQKAELRLLQHVELEQLITLNVRQNSLPDVLGQILSDDSFTLYQAIPGGDNDANVIPGTLWIFSEGSLLAPTATIFFEAVLDEGTYPEKKEAIRELRRLGTPAAVQALSLALGDPDTGLRDDALYALSQIGGDEALAAIASAGQDSDPRIRAEAAVALASGDSETSAQYLAMALDDPDPRVRMAVIESLADVPYGTVPSEQAVAVIRGALEDEDYEVRMSALDALEEIGGEVAYRSLSLSHPDSQ